MSAFRQSNITLRFMGSYPVHPVNPGHPDSDNSRKSGGQASYSGSREAILEILIQTVLTRLMAL
ncbi:MAG: hypothetical protein HQK66_08625 [Desulfamplus sp.]|nr:hypothetical protein [Desulfamplus sp.]